MGPTISEATTLLGILPVKMVEQSLPIALQDEPLHPIYNEYVQYKLLDKVSRSAKILPPRARDNRKTAAGIENNGPPNGQKQTG